MSELTSRHLEAFQRFLELLPHGKEPEVVLLKGHLLIEEQIRALIDHRLRNPKTLREANVKIECHLAISLARAFFPPGHMDNIWEAVFKLNKLRNSIAHGFMDKQSLTDQIEAWVQNTETGARELKNTTERLEFTLWAIFEAVSSFVDDSGTWGFDSKSYGERESVT